MVIFMLMALLWYLHRRIFKRFMTASAGYPWWPDVVD